MEACVGMKKYLTETGRNGALGIRWTTSIGGARRIWSGMRTIESSLSPQKTT